MSTQCQQRSCPTFGHAYECAAAKKVLSIARFPQQAHAHPENRLAKKRKTTTTPNRNYRLIKTLSFPLSFTLSASLPTLSLSLSLSLSWRRQPHATLRTSWNGVVCFCAHLCYSSEFQNPGNWEPLAAMLRRGPLRP